MISFLAAYKLKQLDEDAGFELSVERALFMCAVESVMFMLYMDFGIRILEHNPIMCMFISILFSIFACVTCVIDWWTGYVYDIINILVLIIIIIVSVCFSDVSSIFNFYLFLYVSILVMCEKVNAFCRGDTEFLIVMYFFFINNADKDFSVKFMLFTLLMSAVLFGIFRRMTGRKEGMMPYTPFIVLSEIINILIFSFYYG